MANKLLLTNLERFVRRINSPFTRPKLPKMAIFKPPNFTKNDHSWNIFSNSSSGQQYFSNDIKKFRQNWLVKKSKVVWRKNPPRAQKLRYFRIEVGTKTSIEIDSLFSVVRI